MMATIDALLFELGQRGIQLWLEGDRLRYRAEKNVLTPELLTEVKNKKPEIIDFLREASASSQQELPAIKPLAVGQAKPLSFAQERLWFLHQFEPEGTSNNMPVVVRFSGTLDVNILEKSIQLLVQRQAVLRTRFPKINGKPSLVVEDKKEIQLTFIDLRQLPEEQRDQETLALATKEARQPFDLVNGPILRVKLFQLKDTEYLFIWNMHCIVCDGASSDVFYQDLTQIYQSLILGENVSLKALPVQYTDFAHWQRQWLQGEVLQSLLDYWKKTLEGNLPLLKLPFDHPRPVGVQTYRGDRAPRLLSLELHQSLTELSQQLGGTLFMTLLAAFEVLLYRYSSQKEMLLSFACSGRGQVETEGLIGFFTNTLMQRTSLHKNLTFRELFDQVKVSILEAFAHQDIPFEKLIEELHSGQNQRRSPLFQVKFALNPPWTKGKGMSSVQLPDLNINSLFGYIYHGKTKYDLILVMREQENGLGMVFDYNAEMFESSTMERMLDQFQILLEGIVAHPDQKITDLPILTESEKRKVLIDWSPPAITPSYTSITEAFEVQVTKTPEAIALITDHQSLTYTDLNQQVNQLAHYLQESGVRKHTKIGLCLERSLIPAIAILAILKISAIYVPLSPQLAQEEVKEIALETEWSLLFTEEKFIHKFSDFHDNIIVWEAISTRLDQYSSKNLGYSHQLSHFACISYSSFDSIKGIKDLQGVMVSHGNILQLINGDLLKISSKGTYLQFANIGSAVATFEMFSALLNGGQLAIYPQDAQIDGLGDFIETHKITTLRISIHLFHYLVDQHLGKLKFTRNILIGGDTFSLSLVQKIKEKFPQCNLTKTFSFPENTAIACAYPLDGNLLNNPSLIIGKPFSGTQAYVLGLGMKPLPIGGIGRLYLGGLGLSKGYFNQPEKTKKYFLENPFSTDVESKLFKTDYVVRYLPDGNIKVLGNINQDVIVEGFKVYLVEIEAAVNCYPIVQESFIMFAEQEDKKPNIVAYIKCASDQVLNIAALRQFLKQKLPDYMIPNVFIEVSSLPLTIDGELDQESLPKIQNSGGVSADEFLPPQTPLEQELADIWGQALKREKIGRFDNFFELGGNSILAVKLFAEIEKTWEIQLPLSILFQVPSIYELAKVIERKGEPDHQKRSCLVALQPNGSRVPLFCTHAIGTSVHFYRNLLKYLSPDQPLYGLQSRFLEQSEENTNLTIEDMAAFYIQEIQKIQPQGPYLLGGYSYGGTVVYEMAQQLQKAGHKIALVAIIDTYAPGGYRQRSKSEQILQHWANFQTSGLAYVTRKVSDQVDFQTRKLKQLVEERIQTKQEFVGTDKNTANTVAFFKSRLRKIEALHLETKQRYKFKKYAGKITLFRSSDSLMGVSGYLEENLGWDKWVEGTLKVYDIPGNHYLIFDEPHVQIFAEKLNACIEEALQSV